MGLYVSIGSTSCHHWVSGANMLLGGGNSNIFYVHPEPWGFMIQFDEHIFQMGGEKPPTRLVFRGFICFGFEKIWHPPRWRTSFSLARHQYWSILPWRLKKKHHMDGVMIWRFEMFFFCKCLCVRWWSWLRCYDSMILGSWIASILQIFFQDQGGGLGESQMHSELWWIEVVSNKQPLRGLKACWDIRQFKISSFGMIQILIKNSWVLLLLCFTGATYIRCLRIGYVENWSIGRPPDGTKTYRWKGCLERTKR